jgi:hypothetical protein
MIFLGFDIYQDHRIGPESEGQNLGGQRDKSQLLL